MQSAGGGTGNRILQDGNPGIIKENQKAAALFFCSSLSVIKLVKIKGEYHEITGNSRKTIGRTGYRKSTALQQAFRRSTGGDKYVVTWALGHLVTLADPEEYDKKYQKWDMATLPMMPEKMQLVVIRQTAKQYQTVKTQLYRKDIGEVIIATDAGREGELVARWILEKAGCHKPIKRLWISPVTDKAIKEGFAHLSDGRKYQHLYEAAVCRAEADWLVGMNGTRALTCKHNAQLSCGRVQTPTLAMIARREQQIRDFQPQEYYGVQIQDGQIRWTWQDEKSGSYRTFARDRAEKLLGDLKGRQLTVTEVKENKSSVLSPGLYDLTELQRDASRMFGYSAKQTLNIMQQLYEHHKVLTYPRTDSRYISKDVARPSKNVSVPSASDHIRSWQEA